MRLEDLQVYQRLCQLHIDVCDLSQKWPNEERYELGSQVRRSSNSSPAQPMVECSERLICVAAPKVRKTVPSKHAVRAQLAEKHGDRHIRNKIEGVNRSRGKASETIHHLYMARLKGYIDEPMYQNFRERYQECIRMLNGLERTLEKQLPENQRRWHEAGR